MVYLNLGFTPVAAPRSCGLAIAAVADRFPAGRRLLARRRW